MRASDFDALTRQMAGRTTRRSLLLVAASALAASRAALASASRRENQPDARDLCAETLFHDLACGSLCCVSDFERCYNEMCRLNPDDPASPAATPMGIVASPTPAGCGEDSPTIESLDRAAAELAQGAEEVTLSPLGCVGYQRRMSGDRISYEAFLEAGQIVELRYAPDPDTALVLRDDDGDGFAEQRITYRLNPSPDVSFVRTTWSLIPSQDAYRLASYERISGNHQEMVGVERVQWNQDGTILEETGFTTSAYVESAGTGASVRPDPGRYQTLGSACGADEEALIRQRLKEGIAGSGIDVPGSFGGLHCIRQSPENRWMRNYLMRAYMNEHISSKRIEIACADTLTNENGKTVNARTHWYWLPVYNDRIVINRSTFFSLSPEQQRALMFHEILHPHVGQHTNETEGERETEDLIYSCQEYCFGTRDRCNCATCLQTSPCSPLCKDLTDCVETWRCPCPQRPKEYPTETECAADCPRGLACFSYTECERKDRCS